MGNFLEELKTVQISLFAIDEAHCISEWGHDFRPDYLSLTHITDLFPDIPVAAFTATATVKVQDDIIKKIDLRSPYVVRAPFNSHNLFYQVKRKEQVEYQILNFIHEHENEPGIVYRTTRDSVLKLADFLSENGIHNANLGPKRIKGETIQKIHEHFEKGLTMEQIAKIHNLAKSTIEGYLEQMIRDRKDIDINRLVDPAKQDEIKESFLTLMWINHIQDKKDFFACWSKKSVLRY